MPFEGTLTIEDKNYRVFSFKYSASRDHDRFGRPTSQLYGGRMEFVVEHSPDCVLLHSWAYNNHEMRNGRITFMQRNSMQRQTELRFSDGYITSIETSFSNDGDTPMTEKIIICANNFEYESMGNLALFEMEWPT